MPRPGRLVSRAGVVALVTLLVLAAPASALGATATATATPTSTSGATAASTGETVAAAGAIETARAGVTAPATAPAAATRTQTGNQDSRPDPDSDRLGWEAGYWYDEELSIDRSDGLSRSELRKVLARSAARVERIRQLEFDRLPELRFVSREEYRGFTDRAYGSFNATTPQRLHQNTKFEALFFIGEEESYFEAQAANQGGTAAAFYTSRDIPQLDISAGTIAIITPSDGTPDGLAEPTLGHELTHALQVQQFGSGVLDTAGRTEEAYRANLSLTEGDATYVGQSYGVRCEEEWSCLSSDGGGGGAIANFGLAIYGFAAYGETGAFIEAVRAERGWEGVNALYEPGNRPASTEQYIHPERYFEGDRPTEVTVEHRTAGDWELLDLPDSDVDHATFGEAGVFTMLWYPSYEARENVIVPLSRGSNDPLVRFDFTHPASEGWDGDKLYPYVNDSSAATNETGYVWKTVWDSPEDAREFADAYRQLLEFREAEQVGERTYVIPESEFGQDFADAFYVVRDGDTVTIVNAPTVTDLSKVRTSVQVDRQDDETTTTTAGATTTATTATTTAGATTTTTDDPPGREQPGFTALTAAVALVALVALLRRRR
jgi:MYXO-CTERM domain-containing protein